MGQTHTQVDCQQQEYYYILPCGYHKSTKRNHMEIAHAYSIKAMATYCVT